MINLESLEYPYYFYTIQNKDIKDDFEELKQNKEKRVKDKNSLLTFKINYMKNLDLYKLTDFFSEDVRVKCNFKDKISPYQFYQNSKYFKKDIDIQYEKIDDFIYKNSKICSNFPITIALEVYRCFGAKKVLDFSSGWGDRLIAAMAYGCEYTGVDPNEDMKDKYIDMIDFFNRSHNKYKVYTQGFETFKIKKNYYDLVFTSPPFFDLEVYSQDDTQSIQKFHSLEEWKRGFMFMSIKKSKESLVEGGYLALYISDFYQTKYVRDTIIYAKSIGLEYKGYLSWLGERYPKKIFVWVKHTS